MNVTATQLKQQAHILSFAKDEEIIVTKRDKPFAVIIDFDRYNELIRLAKIADINNKLGALDALGSFGLGGKDFAQIKSEMGNE